MNELYFTINFSKQKFIINGVDLISGDYNSTKIKFNFEDYKEGTKVIEIRPALSEDKNPTFMSTITNNEVILTSIDESNHKVSPFTTGGVYLVEVSVYGNDSKLSTITKSLNILEEQIILSDDIVTPYLPIFDELIQEINTAITETNNLNITITKENGITTITLTKKDGTVETFSILDGIDGTDGVGISNITKIATVGLVDTYRITLTDDSYYDYQITNGKGIVSITKTNTTEYTDTYTITYNDGTTTTFTVTNGTLTIPELYQELSYITNILPKVSGTGSNIALNNTGNSRLLELELEGKSIQDGTPTPSSPVDIQSVGTYDSDTGKYKIDVITHSNNYFNYPYLSDTNNTYVTQYRIGIISGLKPNTQYSLYNYNIHDATTVYIYLWTTDQYTTSTKAYISSPYGYASKATITSNADGNLYLAMATSNSTAASVWENNIGLFSNAILSEGTTEIDYIPYGASTRTFSLNNPLRGIGDIKDLLYIENSVLKIRRYVGNVTLNGTETFYYSGYSDPYYRVSTPISTKKTTSINSQNSSVMSNYFRPGKWDSGTAQGESVFELNGDNRAYFIINKSYLEDYSTNAKVAESFKTWLTTHNTELNFVLATPTNETVGVIDLPSTFYNVTNIMTDDSLDPNIRATALKDISNL